MKTILVALLLVVSNIALAKETINVYSKFNLSDVGTRQINGIITQLNDMSDKYTFRLNSVPGAFGEASVRKSIADARVGMKSILFTTVDTLTILKELETSDQKFVYDKNRDLIPLQGISSTFHGVFGSPEVYNFDTLINQLKPQKEFFYGYTSNAVVPKLSADILIKHYGLSNGKAVLYKSQADLQLAVINKEIVFGVGSITEAVSDSNLKLLLSTSKTRSRFFPDVPVGSEKGMANFKYNAQTFISVPREFDIFGKELVPMLKAACESAEYTDLLKQLKRNQSCLSQKELLEFIAEEYGWYIDNK
jgi:tripartite-type tricarboxylate transporter receptor subunit TctC